MTLGFRKRSWVEVSLFSLGVFLVSCFNAPSAVAAAAKERGGGVGAQSEKRLGHLEARGPIVSLAEGNFTKYAEGKARSYNLVLLFTATGPSYNCMACRSIEDPFSKAANSYAQQYDIREADNPVVFARVDVASGSGVFKSVGVQTAPHVYLVPRGKNLPKGESDLGEFEVTQTMGNQGHSNNDFLKTLLDVTGVEIFVLPDTSGLLEGVLLVSVALGIITHFFASVPSRVLAVARHKGVWFITSLACYMIGVGGIIYCIIRNPSPFGYDQQTGETIMFSSRARDQYWYEGVLVSLFYIGMSAAMAGVYKAAGSKRMPPKVRTAVVLLCLTALCYLISEYVALYTKKVSWYSLPQLLPGEIAALPKGPLKRKHGLLKRLVRLSHVWLNEYTGLGAFCTKIKSFLWDYLVRRVKTPLGLS